MKHITPEALSGALAAVEAIGVAQGPEHTVRSLTAPVACACGAPVHAGTTWVKTRPDPEPDPEPDPWAEHDALEAQFLASGLPVHCAMCDTALGTPTKPGEGLALFQAHEGTCPKNPYA
jgi:hypothetical protein